MQVPVPAQKEDAKTRPKIPLERGFPVQVRCRNGAGTVQVRTCTVPAPSLHRTCTIPAPYLHRTCPVPAPYLHRSCTVPAPENPLQGVFLGVFLGSGPYVPAPYLPHTCPVPAPFLHRTCTGQPPSRGIVGGVFRSVFLDRTWTYFYACFPQMSVSPDTSLQHGDLEGRRACPQVDGTMSVGGGTRGKHEERGTSGRTESGRASFEISGLN